MRIMKRKPKGKPQGRVVKARRTFTLSPQSIALLEELSALRGSARRRSVSSVLDDLLQALNGQRKRESVERAISAYYDNLSPEDSNEERAWGDFSLTQFIEGAE